MSMFFPIEALYAVSSRDVVIFFERRFFGGHRIGRSPGRTAIGMADRFSILFPFKGADMHNLWTHTHPPQLLHCLG